MLVNVGCIHAQHAMHMCDMCICSTSSEIKIRGGRTSSYTCSHARLQLIGGMVVTWCRYSTCELAMDLSWARGANSCRSLTQRERCFHTKTACARAVCPCKRLPVNARVKFEAPHLARGSL